MSAILRVNQLIRHHRSGSAIIKAVDGVSFSVEPGQFVAITGPSGSGKSTLLSLLAGLDKAEEGEIWIEDVPLHDLNESQRAQFRRKDLGFIFQSFQLFENYTALENVQFPLELQNTLNTDELEKQSISLLTQVGLGERLHHYPQQLSGGEQQRVAIARAFASKPKLLLADEPTGNLDEDTGEKIIEALLELQSQTGCTVLLVTHDTSLANRADRILMMNRGQLTEKQR